MYLAIFGIHPNAAIRIEMPRESFIGGNVMKGGTMWIFNAAQMGLTVLFIF